MSDYIIAVLIAYPFIAIATTVVAAAFMRGAK